MRVRNWFPAARLSWDDVREIRAAAGEKLVVLALRYGVSEATVSRIRNGVSWRV